MDRREFFNEMKKPVILTCAFCLGAACTQESVTPDTGGNTGRARLTVDLNTALQTVGSFVTGTNVILVRLAAGNVPSSFVALQRECTHQGTNVNWNAGANEFICPNHGARFNTSGANIGGQPTAALPRYNIAISGTTLTVS